MGNDYDRVVAERQAFDELLTPHGERLHLGHFEMDGWRKLS